MKHSFVGTSSDEIFEVMAITKKYKNPPLREALCEFTFESGDKKFDKIESEFDAYILQDYPDKSERKDITFVINQTKDKVTSQTKEKRGLIQYRNETGSLVQLGQSILVINQLKPYSTWEKYEPNIVKHLKVYSEISGETILTRLAVRYVNRIDIESNNLRLEDYFNYTLLIPKGVSEDLNNVRMSTEHAYEGGRDVLRVSLYSTASDDPKYISIVFDIRYVMVKPNSINFANIPDWLKVAHTNLNQTFEASLTDKCKLLFD